MRNPWEEISLSDYENHMGSDLVMQLQTMNEMMMGQLSRHPVKTAMILGVAGGNGLEHVAPACMEKVYGVDVNRDYLQTCAARYPELEGMLECLCVDLTEPDVVLPHAELVVANLLIEYIGYGCFQRAVQAVKPRYISCIIQENRGDGFVSASPYLHAFDGLERVHHQMAAAELTAAMEDVGYSLNARTERGLPNGKALIQLDYQEEISV